MTSDMFQIMHMHVVVKAHLTVRKKMFKLLHVLYISRLSVNIHPKNNGSREIKDRNWSHKTKQVTTCQNVQ